MKKSILTVAVSAFVMSAILTSCAGSAEKVDSAQNAVDEANKNLDAANEAYLQEIETYRKDAAAKVEANEKSIAEFNTRVESEKKEAREDYKKKIADLEQKNSDMKKKMDDYKAEGKENWEKFKTEFSKDMEELGNSFKNFTTKSDK